MKNNFIVHGETTVIIINSPKHGVIETLISTSDLERAQEFPGTWCANWSKNLNGFYVTGCLPRNKSKRKIVQLHRWILGVTDPKVQVDHIHHKTLDNRRSELNAVTNAENHQNLRRLATNKSGITGVHWSKFAGKWTACIAIQGARKHLGYFETIEKAAAARKSAELEFHKYKTMISYQMR